MKKINYLTLLLLLSGAHNGLAHPGHDGYNGTEIMHYLTSPLHIGLLGLAGIGAYFLWKARQDKEQKV